MKENVKELLWDILYALSGIGCLIHFGDKLKDSIVDEIKRS